MRRAYLRGRLRGRTLDNARLFLEGRTDELAGKPESADGEAAAEPGSSRKPPAGETSSGRSKTSSKRPQAISVGLEDLDAVGFARSGDAAALHVFFMRRGKIRDSRGTFAEGTEGRSDREVLADLLGRFYARAEKPPKILLPFEPADAERLAGRVWPAGPERRPG